MEINLLNKYPKTKRNLDERKNLKSEEVREIARKFGKEFFDGDRKYGYGGFNYNSKYWSEVVLTFKDFWKIKEGDSLLDIGCAKGFMIYDFYRQINNIQLKGIDISNYAIENSHEEIKKFLSVADAKSLPFDDGSFDHVISINTIHNLDIDDCIKAIKEIIRVSKKNSFITVDAFKSDEEKKRMFDWNLTAKTILSVDEWKNLFKEIGYEGDFFWFTP
jgi:ubiquinone/menaquinone biosynthesis C-methylase UbiE